ncbi:hypothetical protein [Methanomethylovorans sp.]|uniref:DUF7289 family protein n=1 Tax=Methanomethylovorans sp. TaxID=2758717 RepID=UPI00351C88AA
MKTMLKNEIAVSSVIGISIILVISLLSIGLMLLYTAPLISETQEMAKAQKAEQAFTVFDSRTSKASLGESPLQTTTLTLMGENVAVRGDDDSYNESRIMIIALSSNSDWYDGFYSQRGAWNAWKDYEIEDDFAGFNASMGKVRYYSEDRVIAYEGGGIWSRYPEGGTVMISPPEFHYNGETLTLPIMKVNGDDSSGGSSNVNINVRSSNTPVVLYPNTDPNTGNENFTNPLNCEKIFIYINSEFYDGWAEYAETLTTTTAMLDHKNKTAIIEMDTRPAMGTFPLMHSFKIGRLNQSNSTPIGNFSFYYEASEKAADKFNPSDSSIVATSGKKTLIYSIDTKNIDSKKHIYLRSIKYTDDMVGMSEEWTSAPNNGFLIYTSNKPPKKTANTTIDLVSDSHLVKYNSASGDFSWGPVGSITMTPDLNIAMNNANSTQSLNNITQHYMKLLAKDGTIQCTWNQKKDQISESKSTYTLIYDGGGGVLTYLHITSNELNVTLD